MDRRSEALAQLLETALSERFAMPVMEVLHAMPIPVAVIEARDLRLLALNDAMATFLHRPDAAGLTITAVLPPAHPLSDQRPYRTVVQDARPFSETVVVDGQAWSWFIRPLKGDGEIVEVSVAPENSPAANYGFDVTPRRLVTGLITERGVCKADEKSILELFPEHAS